MATQVEIVRSSTVALQVVDLGEKTLLIDSDLRKARLHKFFGLENSVGHPARLNNLNLGKILKRVERLHDLTLLTSSSEAPNLIDQPSRTVFELLLASLGKDYDVEVVDAPNAK